LQSPRIQNGSVGLPVILQYEENREKDVSRGWDRDLTRMKAACCSVISFCMGFPRLREYHPGGEKRSLVFVEFPVSD
jgi:hypothetical protein